MKNFMIIDTEKTYNIGVVIFNKAIIYKKQFVVKENFEDRKICGEQNYKRKKALFDNHPDVEYGNAVEICNKLTQLVQTYHIETIFAHNCAEDRISITNLYKQCEVYCTASNIFDIANLVDSIKIVKTLYPENLYTSLEDTINDILGVSLHQVHTALDDCIWLSTILIPLAECLDLYTSAEYIMNNLKDNAIIDIINFFPEYQEISDVELFTAIADADEDEYTIKTLNTRLKELVTCNILSVREEARVGKNGQPLKTMSKIYKFTNPFGLDIIKKVKYFKTTDFQTKIEKLAGDTLLPYTSKGQQENLTIFKEAIKKELEAEYLEQINKLNNENTNLQNRVQDLEHQKQQTKTPIISVPQSTPIQKENIDYTKIKQEILQELQQEKSMPINKKNGQVKLSNNQVRKTWAIILTIFGGGCFGIPQFLCKRPILGILSIILTFLFADMEFGLGPAIPMLVIPIISIIWNKLD